jgi:hypothetical protein
MLHCIIGMVRERLVGIVFHGLTGRSPWYWRSFWRVRCIDFAFSMALGGIYLGRFRLGDADLAWRRARWLTRLLDGRVNSEIPRAFASGVYSNSNACEEAGGRREGVSIYSIRGEDEEDHSCSHSRSEWLTT